MSEPDTDAMLLDKIGGKYGDGSDYEDIGNADEDALLADDAEFLSKHSHLYDDSLEELDHEPEEPDSEDILDLEAQDVELEDPEDKQAQLSQSVTSTTASELDISVLNKSDMEDREREDRFKSERGITTSKSNNIPDSLDKVQVVASVQTLRNGKRGMTQFKNRGRGGNHNNRNTQNQTVLINPHFKGHVKINNNARLAWDARQKINQKNQQLNQVGRIAPFSQNRNQNQNITSIQPWINNNNNRGPVSQNVPHFQPPPPQMPVYQPHLHQQPQVPHWNQYQPNAFSEVPHHMGMNSNQIVFMHPLPQNVYSNQQIQPQFNQPPPHFTAPQYPPPLYSNAPQNTGFGNNQFLPPPSQYGQSTEQMYSSFPQVQQNQYIQGPNNPQYNQQMNTFNKNRFMRSKSNFSHLQKNNKRKLENADLRKKKRNLTSNLHEVHTVEIPDTTMKEEVKVMEEEDEETRQYRLKIEEQKRKREAIIKMKEERRLKLIQNSEGTNQETETILQPHPVQDKPPYTQQKNSQVVWSNSRSTSVPMWTQQITTLPSQVFNNNNNININTNNDGSNYDKQHIASFLSNRKILTRDQSLIDTSIVVISNLSAGTTDVKLRKMCRGIGVIKKLQMSFKERQATIRFNSVASAHAFFKKYQRTMIDLSMIQVTLKPIS